MHFFYLPNSPLRINVVPEQYSKLSRDCKGLLWVDFVGETPAIDETIDQIEDEVFDRPNPWTLERLFVLKRILLSMRRILLPQREVLNKLRAMTLP